MRRDDPFFWGYVLIFGMLLAQVVGVLLGALLR